MPQKIYPMDNLTPEELAAEQAATQVPKEDEIRESIINDYGFDADADTERIDKLVAKEVENRKKLSAAIGQKIKHRKEVEELRKNNPPKKEDKKEEKKDDFVFSPKDNLALIRAEVEDEDLDEVLEYARFKKVSVSEALKLPLLKSRLAELKQERATALATQTKGGNRGVKKETGEAILERARQQNLPNEEDDEGIGKLAGAHLAARFKQR